jgi:H+/Cl- antiporter ClcA
LRRKQFLRWVVMFLIGIFTGLVAVIIDTIVEYISEIKYSYITKCKLFCKICFDH